MSKTAKYLPKFILSFLHRRIWTEHMATVLIRQRLQCLASFAARHGHMTMLLPIGYNWMC